MTIATKIAAQLAAEIGKPQNADMIERQLVQDGRLSRALAWEEARREEARFRGAMRARRLRDACHSSFPERRAMLTAVVIVDERFPMLRQSSHFNDGPNAFLAAMERARLRRAVEANICDRLVVKYRRMMGEV